MNLILHHRSTESSGFCVFKQIYFIFFLYPFNLQGFFTGQIMSFENILAKLRDPIISLYPDITQDELTLRMKLGEEMLQRM